VPIYRDKCSPKSPAHGPLILKPASLVTMQLTSLLQRWRQKVPLTYLLI